MKVSTLLGFRPNDAVMSFNEVQWWEAYSGCRPLEADRIDLMEARLLAIHANKSPKDVIMNWFDATPENDEDMRKEQHDKRLKHARKLEADRKLKEK